MTEISLKWPYYQQLLIKLISGLIIFLIFWIAARVIDKTIRRVADRLVPGKRQVVNLGASVARFSLMLIGVISALGTLGMNVSALVASLGLTGFALGFALKDALGNLLAGILILFYQPFVIGDRIKVGSVEGIVTEINLRYTTIKGKTETYLVPNSMILNNTVTLQEQRT